MTTGYVPSRATGQGPHEPPISEATAAAWRRHLRQTRAAPPSDDGEKHANGFHVVADTAPSGSLDATADGFAESQHEALAAMINLAAADVAASPAREPCAPRFESPGSPPELTVSAAFGQSAPVIAQSPVVDQSALPAHPELVTHGDSPTEPERQRRKRRPVRKSRILARIPRPSLTAILTVQAILSLRLVWSNTAFQDEALYLWAGRVEWAQWLHGTVPPQDLYDPFAAYFSGAPVIYPPLAALANGIGGLAGARILSLGFMLVTTALLYDVTQRIFDRRAALFGAALFVGTGSTQFLGAFATFDAMALMLLALATWLGVRAAESRPRAQVALLVLAASALALADASKYAATLFDPVVLAVSMLSVWRSRGIKNGLAAGAIVLGVLCALLLIGIRLGGHGYWQGITFTTLTRSSGTTPAPGVAYVSGTWVGAIAVLAIIGAAAATYASSRAAKTLAWLLASAVFLAPAEQARIHTITSLFKHVDFGAWFGCVVAGYALASLVRAVPAAKASAAVTVGACVVILAAIVGFGFAGSHVAQWPNSSKMTSDLKPVIIKTGCPCLLAAAPVVDYYLPKETFPDQFTTAYYFRYWDKAESRMLHGTSAYEQAIGDHYFKLVEIDPSENPIVYGPVTRALAVTSGYKLIDTIQSNVAHMPFEIWVYSPGQDSGLGAR